MQTTVIASKTPGAKPALLSGNRRLGAEPNGPMPHRTDHRHPSAASLPSERRDLLAMGAAKQGKKQANSTQITQIKPKITPLKIAGDSCKKYLQFCLKRIQLLSV
jgi:hypothetical protein